MSDEKKYTTRDIVLARRESFWDGAQWRAEVKQGPSATAEAERRFKLPKVTRPRVVTIRRSAESLPFQYAVVKNALVQRWSDDEEWSPCPALIGHCVPAFLVAVGELAADPTEEVDE